MPEGDSLRRAVGRLQVLVGQRVEVETPHPRAAAKRLAERLDGRVLERVDASGKNLLLRFEGGIVLRSHLRMTGRWRVEPRGTRRSGRPWLVLRGREHEAVLWNGPILDLVTQCYLADSSPDILGSLEASPAERATPGGKTATPAASPGPPDFDAMLARLRAAPQERQLGDALLDQRLVAGIGNVWRAEALWRARVSPWRTLGDTTDDELLATLRAAHELMRASVDGRRPPRQVYRRAGRACRRCGEVVRSAPQGEHARTAYWCPRCQVGGSPPPS